MARRGRRSPGAQWPPGGFPKWHAAAAVLYAGELTSMLDGIAMNTPSLPMAWVKLPEDGGVVVGSGKSVIPCARMQVEIASIWRLACAEGGPPPPGPPPGSSFWQVACAALNAGEKGWMPELGVIEMRKPWPPEPAAGSGKFGTPCERMQSENLSPSDLSCEADGWLGSPDEPQAAIASPHRTTGNAVFRYRGLCVSVALRIMRRVLRRST